MRRFLLSLVFASAALAQQATPPSTPLAIDWARAQALHQRATRGEKLTADEQRYYDEARRQRAAGGARPPQAPPPPAPKDLIPLTDLKSSTYHDEDGGLYGGGQNQPPPALAARAAKAVSQIQPLDDLGKPLPGGRIVLMSIGMSNTTQEFSTFQRLANADPRKSPSLTIVDGAQGARTAAVWAGSDQPWEEAGRRLTSAGVTSAQVQVLWIKQANAGPTAGWPAATDQLRDDIRKLIARARTLYPNLRLIFLSSRIYAGYATTRLNPEPYAYEGAFAVRALIREQPEDGPALLWGPYLWTNGETGRAIDDLKWLREDVGPDGTHPSRSGQQKVARLLLDFFTTNPNATPWFSKP